MITEEVKKQVAAAMKSGEKVRLSTLKLLLSELHNAEIDNKGKLNESQEIEIVVKEVKKRKDAIAMYDKAGKDDRVEQEEMELAILTEFLPEQLSDEELEKNVDEAIKIAGASGIKDMGKVIGIVKSRVGMKADGKRVAEAVTEKLKQ